MPAKDALTPDLKAFAGRVVRTQLANGLTVLIVPRRRSATLHFAIAFGVGGVDEEAGRSGIAHLYEHMAFKGTRDVGTTDAASEEKILAKLDLLDARMQAEKAKNDGADAKKLAGWKKEFDRLEARAEALVDEEGMDELYARNGAKGLNAYTAKDLTVYIVSLPSNRARLWAALEAGRVKAPVLRQFYRERNVVIEEMRRYDDMPNWRMYDALPMLAFAAHPYRTPIIGWKSDVERMTRKDLEEFFRSRYRPDKATIAVVGDCDPDEMFALIRREFGNWTGPAEAPRPVTTVEPEQRGERRMEQRMQASPLLGIAWPVPTWGHPDKTAIDALTTILGAGDSSRLNSALVKRDRIAVQAAAFTGFPGERYPNLLTVYAVPLAPRTVAEVEAAVDAEIAKLAADGPTKPELEKAVNMKEAEIFRKLGDNSDLAVVLADANASLGDWQLPLKQVGWLRALTPADVKRVAAEYLVAHRKNVVAILPKEKA